MFPILKQITLDNGVRIIYEHIPHVRSVSLGMWVKAGSRNERKQEAGVSHFIEHMLFKGTEARSAKQIADEMDEIGGQLNAYTTKEYTCYYARTLTSHISIAIDVLADMFFHSVFDEQEIEKEKTVIIEEINMYEDSPEDLIHDILQQGVWGTQPLGNLISGDVGDIENITRDKIIEYYKAYYIPQNTVISIVGYFDEDEIIGQIKKYFAHWENSNICIAPVITPQYQPTFIMKDKDIEQVHMCMTFPGISLKSKDVYAMSILNTAFGGGMSSRLFQEIREERGLVYSIYSYPSTFTDTGLFTIYAGLNPTQLGEVAQLIMDEIQNLFTDPISELIMHKTKQQLKSNYILGLESTSSRMSRCGKTLLLLDKTEEQDKVLEDLERASIEQIEQVIQSVFNLENMSIALVGNSELIEIEGIRSYVKNSSKN